MKDQNKEKQESEKKNAENQPNLQDKPDDTRVPTITPANENGEPGPAKETAKN